MRIDNGSGGNGLPPIVPNNSILEVPPPSHSPVTDNPTPNPIEPNTPVLNDNIDQQIQTIQNTIQNYNATHQTTLIDQIQELPDVYIERLTDTFITTEQELPLEVLQAFISRLASPDKHFWDDLFKSTLLNASIHSLTQDNNSKLEVKLNETTTNILNIYLLLFRIKDCSSLELSESVHAFLNNRPSNTDYYLLNNSLGGSLHNIYYDMINCIINHIITSKITVIQEKFPSYTTKPANPRRA